MNLIGLKILTFQKQNVSTNQIHLSVSKQTNLKKYKISPPFMSEIPRSAIAYCTGIDYIVFAVKNFYLVCTLQVEF